MAPGDPTRHLGLDLGATNLKWAVLERDDESWTRLDHGQLPTAAAEGAGAVLGRMAGTAAEARSRWPGIESVGLGVPGLYDAEAGITTFLPNLPPDWADLPVAEPLAERIGLPVRLINDARAFGLALDWARAEGLQLEHAPNLVPRDGDFMVGSDRQTDLLLERPLQ